MEITVQDLVERFDAGTIRLPMMQRDYVWRAKKVVRLLDSLYKGWPIGSFYVWQTKDDPGMKPSFGLNPVAKSLDGFYGFLLDGQQRLTSLSLAIQPDSAAEMDHRAFFDVVNDEFFLGEMKRSVTKRIQAGDPTLVPLSELIMPGKGDLNEVQRAVDHVIGRLREMKRLGRGDSKEIEYRTRLAKVSQMLRVQALCDDFRDDDEQHAFELFSRLNKGGTSLSAGDVEAARLASASTRKVVGPMRSLAQEQDIKALGIGFVFLLRTLVTVHRGNCSFAKLPRGWASDAREVEASWKKTEQALQQVVAFVRTKLGWRSRRWLPSTMALIPVVYLVAHSGRSAIKAKEADAITRYLLISGLRGLFRGTTETTVNSHVNAVRKCEGQDRILLAKALLAKIPKNRQFKIRKEDISAASALYGPLMQTYFAYLFQEEARSWPSGRTLREVLDADLKSDPLAVHHVFPKKFMQQFDVPAERLNTMANYAVLSQADNSELCDHNPHDVWTSLSHSQRDWASLQLCFSASDQLLQPGAYDEFVAFRSDKLADRLNQFLGF